MPVLNCCGYFVCEGCVSFASLDVVCNELRYVGVVNEFMYIHSVKCFACVKGYICVVTYV